jgi:hypothetical protein
MGVQLPINWKLHAAQKRGRATKNAGLRHWTSTLRLRDVTINFVILPWGLLPFSTTLNRPLPPRSNEQGDPGFEVSDSVLSIGKRDSRHFAVMLYIARKRWITCFKGSAHVTLFTLFLSCVL